MTGSPEQGPPDDKAELIRQIAESEDDPRVRVELRPRVESDSNEYELVMTNSNGTRAYALPFSVGGLVVQELLEDAREERESRRGFE